VGKRGKKPTKTHEEHVQFRQMKYQMERRMKLLPQEERLCVLSFLKKQIPDRDYEDLIEYLRKQKLIG